MHGEHLLFEGRKMAKSTGNVVLVSDVVERGHDPLALRLAFLSSRYRQQANLSWDAIAGAARTLDRWRAAVAAWAESPSAPIAQAWADEVLEAVEDDLDTPRALQVLRRLEKATDVPDGAKFETFAWADRLLGLDLARSVGQAPAGGRAARRRAGAARRAGRGAGRQGLRRVRPPARRARRARRGREGHAGRPGVGAGLVLELVVEDERPEQRLRVQRVVPTGASRWVPSRCRMRAGRPSSTTVER